MAFANSLTLTQLIEQVRFRADMVNSTFCTDAEITDYINSGLFELYGLLATAFQDFNLSTTTIASDGVNDKFNLPADFYMLRGVDLDVGGGRYVALKPFPLAERNHYATPAYSYIWPAMTSVRYRLAGTQIWFAPKPTGQSFRVLYTPAFTPITSGSSTAAAYGGWLDYAIVWASRKCLAKEESDLSALEAELVRIAKRIEEEATNRDAGMPMRIADTASGFDPYGGGSPWGYWY